MKEKTKINVRCGENTDSFESLKAMCAEKSEELKSQIEIPVESSVEVAFWTSVVPELICIGDFRRNENGEVFYELDFSQATL